MKEMMTKIEDVKITTIDNIQNIKWDEKIETIYPQTIDIPDYSYGRWDNTLDYNVALRNKPTPTTWLQVAIWSITITSTWNKIITWVWFKPKYVTFSYSAVTWLWDWNMTSIAQSWYDPKRLTRITTDCIYIRDATDNVIARAQYVSFNNDWFTINCSFSSANLTVYYTCFW